MISSWSPVTRSQLQVFLILLSALQAMAIGENGFFKHLPKSFPEHLLATEYCDLTKTNTHNTLQCLFVLWRLLLQQLHGNTLCFYPLKTLSRPKRRPQIDINLTEKVLDISLIVEVPYGRYSKCVQTPLPVLFMNVPSHFLKLQRKLSHCYLCLKHGIAV